MSEPIFRASSLGRLMTEPRTKSEGALSQGAKTTSESLPSKKSSGRV